MTCRLFHLLLAMCGGITISGTIAFNIAFIVSQEVVGVDEEVGVDTVTREGTTTDLAVGDTRIEDTTIVAAPATG